MAPDEVQAQLSKRNMFMFVMVGCFQHHSQNRSLVFNGRYGALLIFEARRSIMFRQCQLANQKYSNVSTLFQ